MIRCDRVTYIYGRGTPMEVQALTDVSLVIGAGEFVGIIGATGSGKSTLIQHFNGLLKPTSGRVEVDDVDIHARHVDRRRVRQQIGLLFQYPEHQLFEETVIEDVAFGPRNLGLPEAEALARARAALEQVGLPPDRFGARSPFGLSGGEMRRAAIAGVLAMEPRMLILDEPTAGLDPQGRHDLMEHIRRLHAGRGLTVVLVTHSMDAVAQLCRRLLVLQDGCLVADGPTRAVFTDVLRLDPAGLGLPQVTQLAGRLRERGLAVRPDILTVDEARAAIRDALARRGGPGQQTPPDQQGREAQQGRGDL
jgi:energy-coupling factor transport system ATP-binding protein